MASHERSIEPTFRKGESQIAITEFKEFECDRWMMRVPIGQSFEEKASDGRHSESQSDFTRPTASIPACGIRDSSKLADGSADLSDNSSPAAGDPDARAASLK